MTTVHQARDITDIPELSRLADEVRATRRPRILRRGNEDVAMLVPLAHAVLTPMPYNRALTAALAWSQNKRSPWSSSSGRRF
jgi:hypothetical protein